MKEKWIVPCLLIRLAIAALLALVTNLQVMAGSARPDAVRLVSGGQSEYAILTGKNPSATVELAAAELARYLEQISGAELPIIQDDIDNCSCCGGRGATRAAADTACLAAAWRRRAVRPPTTDTAIRLQVKSGGEIQESATWRGSAPPT